MFLRKHWRAIGLSSLVLVLAGFLVICVTIGRQVQGAVDFAQVCHAGDPVTALMAVAGSDQHELRERNQAVWALGQLGAVEALPLLESLVDERECQHDERLCQRELAKAIGLCSGATNIGAAVWRHGELASR